MSTASREKRLRHSSGTRESMTFNDVAVDFTPEEWGYLGPSEKELYSDVMLENYGHLVHLGLTVSKPDVICHLERGDPPWKPVIKVPRTSFPDCCEDECGRNSLRCDSDGETRLETMGSSIKGNISLETFSQKNLKRASILSSSCREAQKPGASLGRHQSSKVEHSWIDLGENSCKYLECLKGFKGSKDFTKHKKIHTGENAFECHVDGKEFSRAVLSSHVRIHSGEKPQDYCECEKAFSSNTNLIQHVKIHTRDKPYECPEFGKPSYKKAHLNQHMRSYTEEKLYEFPECGKTFCSKAYLSEHMNIHNREKPYEGPECAKAFYPKTYLTQHMRIHTGEKPYKCPECGKTFYKKNHLTQYVKIHSGERLGMDYNDCEKTFRQRGSLTQHQRIHTRKKA